MELVENEGTVHFLSVSFFALRFSALFEDFPHTTLAKTTSYNPFEDRPPIFGIFDDFPHTTHCFHLNDSVLAKVRHVPKIDTCLAANVWQKTWVFFVWEKKSPIWKMWKLLVSTELPSVLFLNADIFKDIGLFFLFVWSKGRVFLKTFLEVSCFTSWESFQQKIPWESLVCHSNTPHDAPRTWRSKSALWNTRRFTRLKRWEKKMRQLEKCFRKIRRHSPVEVGSFYPCLSRDLQVFFTSLDRRISSINSRISRRQRWLWWDT